MSDLLDAMDDVKAGRYQKELVSSTSIAENANRERRIASHEETLLLIDHSAPRSREDRRIGRDSLRQRATDQSERRCSGQVDDFQCGEGSKSI